jgi:hypothetical protein
MMMIATAFLSLTYFVRKFVALAPLFWKRPPPVRELGPFLNRKSTPGQLPDSVRKMNSLRKIAVKPTMIRSQLVSPARLFTTSGRGGLNMLV